ncbi:septal ring lytic transglycosylase RlpA family protein [Patescibacteria group bacterium]|nr:septal ring lytic transglycosylase RlpA family protein [Patescibacteria group bacterium]
MLKSRSNFVTTLVAISLALAASSAVAKPIPGQGYERDFAGHKKGSQCQELFASHPYLEAERFETIKTFKADGSYYASRYHNRNPMASGTLYHECDVTVVAYNSLPKGTVLRITNPKTGISQLAVVQDRGGEHVTRRPDLSRGLLETLGGGRPAEEIGLLKGLTYEVLRPEK